MNVEWMRLSVRQLLLLVAAFGFATFTLAWYMRSVSEQRKFAGKLLEAGAVVTFEGERPYATYCFGFFDAHYLWDIEGVLFAEDNYGPVFVSDELLSEMSTHLAGSLHTLQIQHAPELTDHSCGLLQPLLRLETLDLTGTSITENGLKSLSELPSLKKLDISNNELGDDAMEVLRRMTWLTNLSVWDTDITNHALQQLRQNLPETKIEPDAIPTAEDVFGVDD